MKLSLIVAMAQNHIIGRDNAMPWHLPEDLKYFKKVTLNKPVVMGRNTFESIGKPLVNRPNIIITRNADYQAEGTQVVHSLEQALALSKSLLEEAGAPEDSEVMIIGGAQIYQQSLASADRLYLTEVHTTLEGDASFPEFDRNEWQEVSREDHQACERNPYAYSFLVLDRVRN